MFRFLLSLQSISYRGKELAITRCIRTRRAGGRSRRGRGQGKPAPQRIFLFDEIVNHEACLQSARCRRPSVASTTACL